MRVKTILLVGLIVAIFPFSSLQAASRTRSESSPPRTPPVTLDNSVIRDVASTNWHWVYEGAAHGQSFIATGARLESLRLRVARLRDQRPAAPLEVEIRDEQLQKIHLVGRLRPSAAESRFQWAAVEIEHSTPLEPGKNYVLLLHSRTSSHTAPWLINAVFKDAYSAGRHLGYEDELLFSAAYAHGSILHVGPSLNAASTVPFNIAFATARPVPTLPTLRFGGRTCPPVALIDPLGPVPPGEKSVITAEKTP